MVTTSNLAITKLEAQQLNAATSVNEALDILDGFAAFHVVDGIPNAAPPANPQAGQNWIVPASASGAWASQDNAIAMYQTGWTFLTPKKGWQVYDERRMRNVLWHGTAWISIQSARVAELTDSTGGTPARSLADVTGSHSQSVLNNNFASLNTKVNAIMDALMTAQLMAGDAITKIVNETEAVTETTVDTLA